MIIRILVKFKTNHKDQLENNTDSNSNQIQLKKVIH